MACEIKKDGKENVTAFICRKKPSVRCYLCGSNNAPKLCDYPVEGGTCDRSCCLKHSEHMGQDKDYCLAHADAYRDQRRKERVPHDSD